MSAAPQDAPEVHIPARARRRPSSGGKGWSGAGRGTLVVVPPARTGRASAAPTGVGTAPRSCPAPRPDVHRVRAPRALREAPAVEPSATDVITAVPATLLAPAPLPVEVPQVRPLMTEPVRTKVVQTVVLPTPAVLVDGAAILPDGPGSLTPMRLTRRAHWLIAITTAVLGLALVGGAYAGAQGTTHSTAPVPAQVVVHTGDTLWSIAAQVAPNRDPRDEVADLRRINNIGADLTPGQVVRTR